MKSTIWMIPLLLFLAGCAAVLPTTSLKHGTPMADIKHKIYTAPLAENTFQDPVGNPLTVLEYNLRPDRQTQSASPYWFLFFEDKLVAYGLGSTREAQFYVGQLFLNYLVQEKKMDLVTAEQRLYGVYKSLYGSENPLMDEYFRYKIMIAEKLDKGEIDRSEAEYMVSQKMSEIQAKIRQIKYQNAQIQAQKRAQSMALMQMGLQMMQHQQLMNTLNRPHTYTIMPWGRGWIMQGQ
jgi:hypothetical protein